jgi:luciferase family oxidoreductase group 1
MPAWQKLIAGRQKQVDETILEDLGVSCQEAGNHELALTIRQMQVARRGRYLPADHPFKAVRVQPEVTTAPEMWLLGSSDYSGALAAQLGLPFSFAHFINPRGGDEVTRAYRRAFRAGRESAPRVMVCTFLICAQTDDEAERLAAPIDLRRLHMALNVDTPIPTDAEAARHRYSTEEQRYVMSQRARAIIGSPATCRAALEEMARRYEADEVMVLTITGEYVTRSRSYELLIGAFQ